MNSKTEAIGWTSLMNGFAGSEAPKVEWTSLLPFPEEAGIESKTSLGKRTTRILKSLITANKLPMFVLTAALNASPELAEFVATEK